MIADILRRVSTTRQSQEERHGLQRQDDNITSWLSNNDGYEVRKQIVVKGKSAFTGKHLKGDFGNYLKSLRENELVAPDALLIDDFSRLSRLPLDIAQDLVKELARMGISIVTASDGQVYEPSDQKTLIGQLPILVRLEQAHAESARKSAMIRASKRKKRNDAAAGGKITFGNPPKWLTDVGDKFELVPHRAEAIRLIFELVNSGMSKGGVSRELNKRGVKGWDRRGGDTIAKWNSSKVSNIVNARAVTGDHVSRTWKQDGSRSEVYMNTTEANEKGMLIKGAYPKIVSEEVWRLAQTKRDPHFQNLSLKRRASVNDGRSILARVSCGMCGANMRYKSASRGEKYSELICTNKVHGGYCESSSMNHALAEEAVIRLLFEEANLSVLFTKDDSNELLKAEIQMLEAELEELNERVKQKKGKVSSTFAIVLDTKEDELKDKRDQLTKSNVSEYSELVKNWQDVLKGETQHRVRCAEFIAAVTESIEIESIRRGKKVIRIIGEFGQVFSIIEKRNITLYRG